jgi:hypothetical protein
MTTSLSRDFGKVCDDLEIAECFVVYPGTERFGLRQGAVWVGETMGFLAGMGDELRKVGSDELDFVLTALVGAA